MNLKSWPKVYGVVKAYDLLQNPGGTGPGGTDIGVKVQAGLETVEMATLIHSQYARRVGTFKAGSGQQSRPANTYLWNVKRNWQFEAYIGNRNLFIAAYCKNCTAEPMA